MAVGTTDLLSRAALTLLFVTTTIGGCSLLLPTPTGNDWGPPDGDSDSDADSDADADEEGVPCVGGVRCDDGNPCTTDLCDPGGPGSDPTTGCVSVAAPDGSSCDGVFFCRFGETCIGGLCDPDTGSPICNDGYECTDDACDEEANACATPIPRHDLCSGGGWCEPTDPRADSRGCTDGRECTSNAECDDGNWCNGTERCGPERCEGGDPPCVEEATCADVYCLPVLRECRRDPVHARCLDSNYCTDDWCEPTDPAADGAGCVHLEVSCPPDGSPCTDDRCDPSTGHCGIPTPGASCEGTFDCVTGETCDSRGYCAWESGAPRTCGPDGNPCTLDECDEDYGDCYRPMPSGTTCESADRCEVGAQCNSTGQCVGTPRDCRDSDPCTDDRCDPATGECVYPPICGSDGQCCEPACASDPDCAGPDGDADVDVDVDVDVDGDADGDAPA